MKKFIFNIKKYYKYIIRLAKAELKNEINESYLNWLWWIIQPLMMMLIYVFVFTIIFKSRELYYTVFVFLGLAQWDFFSRMLKESVGIIRNNRNIISRVYIPKYVLLLSKSFTFLFKFFISIAITIILMVIFRIPITFKILYFFMIFPVFYIITFGISCILVDLGVYIDDLKKVVEISLKLIFYLSGVFYSIPDRLHGTIGNIMLYFNPIAFFMNEFRKCMLYNQTPNFYMILFWLIVGIVILNIGIYFIHKNENDYVKVI